MSIEKYTMVLLPITILNFATMKKLMLLLALGFAICSFSFGQSITKQEPHKMDQGTMKPVHKNDPGKKGKYDKHKHKHKHRHMHHKKKHTK